MKRFSIKATPLSLFALMLSVSVGASQSSGVILRAPVAPLVVPDDAGSQAAASQAAAAQAASQGAPPASLSVPVTLPQPFEATVASLNALATSAEAALKTYRSDARTLAIRLAVANKIATAQAPLTSIILNDVASLAEAEVLCTPRQNYLTDGVYLNYLNTLVQNINTISVKAAAPTDIPSALKLLLATTNYSVTDKVQIDSGNLGTLATAAGTRCKNDLSEFATDYYGRSLPETPQSQNTSQKDNSSESTPAGDITTFAFLGPIGTLVDTFLSILQPILIDWASLADELRRQQAIMYALSDDHIQKNIDTTGKALADAIDVFSAKSRHAVTGAFVEQLASIRQTPIDLKGVDACKSLKATQTNGVPNASFVACFGAAWSKIQKAVADLNAVGDNYDTVADQYNSKSAKTLFTEIMGEWGKIKQGMANGAAPFYTQLFLNDLTEFVTLAKAVAAAASKTNITALDKAAAAVK